MVELVGLDDMDYKMDGQIAQWAKAKDKGKKPPNTSIGTIIRVSKDPSSITIKAGQGGHPFAGKERGWLAWTQYKDPGAKSWKDAGQPDGVSYVTLAGKQKGIPQIDESGGFKGYCSVSSIMLGVLRIYRGGWSGFPAATMVGKLHGAHHDAPRATIGGANIFCINPLTPQIQPNPDCANTCCRKWQVGNFSYEFGDDGDQIERPGGYPRRVPDVGEQLKTFRHLHIPPFFPIASGDIRKVEDKKYRFAPPWFMGGDCTYCFMNSPQCQKGYDPYYMDPNPGRQGMIQPIYNMEDLKESHPELLKFDYKDFVDDHKIKKLGTCVGFAPEPSSVCANQEKPECLLNSDCFWENNCTKCVKWYALTKNTAKQPSSGPGGKSWDYWKQQVLDNCCEGEKSNFYYLLQKAEIELDEARDTAVLPDEPFYISDMKDQLGRPWAPQPRDKDGKAKQWERGVDESCLGEEPYFSRKTCKKDPAKETLHNFPSYYTLGAPAKKFSSFGMLNKSIPLVSKSAPNLSICSRWAPADIPALDALNDPGKDTKMHYSCSNPQTWITKHDREKRRLPNINQGAPIPWTVALSKGKKRENDFDNSTISKAINDGNGQKIIQLARWIARVPYPRAADKKNYQKIAPRELMTMGIKTNIADFAMKKFGSGAAAKAAAEDFYKDNTEIKTIDSLMGNKEKKIIQQFEAGLANPDVPDKMTQDPGRKNTKESLLDGAADRASPLKAGDIGGGFTGGCTDLCSVTSGIDIVNPNELPTRGRKTPKKFNEKWIGGWIKDIDKIPEQGWEEDDDADTGLWLPRSEGEKTKVAFDYKKQKPIVGCVGNAETLVNKYGAEPEYYTEYLPAVGRSCADDPNLVCVDGLLRSQDTTTTLITTMSGHVSFSDKQELRANQIFTDKAINEFPATLLSCADECNKNGKCTHFTCSEHLYYPPTDTHPSSTSPSSSSPEEDYSGGKFGLCKLYNNPKSKKLSEGPLAFKGQNENYVKSEEWTNDDEQNPRFPNINFTYIRDDIEQTVKTLPPEICIGDQQRSGERCETFQDQKTCNKAYLKNGNANYNCKWVNDGVYLNYPKEKCVKSARKCDPTNRPSSGPDIKAHACNNQCNANSVEADPYNLNKMCIGNIENCTDYYEISNNNKYNCIYVENTTPPSSPPSSPLAYCIRDTNPCGNKILISRDDEEATLINISNRENGIVWSTENQDYKTLTLSMKKTHPASSLKPTWTYKTMSGDVVYQPADDDVYLPPCVFKDPVAPLMGDGESSVEALDIKISGDCFQYTPPLPTPFPAPYITPSSHLSSSIWKIITDKVANRCTPPDWPYTESNCKKFGGGCGAGDCEEYRILDDAIVPMRGGAWAGDAASCYYPKEKALLIFGGGKFQRYNFYSMNFELMPQKSVNDTTDDSIHYVGQAIAVYNEQVFIMGGVNRQGPVGGPPAEFSNSVIVYSGISSAACTPAAAPPCWPTTNNWWPWGTWSKSKSLKLNFARSGAGAVTIPPVPNCSSNLSGIYIIGGINDQMEDADNNYGYPLKIEHYNYNEGEFKIADISLSTGLEPKDRGGSGHAFFALMTLRINYKVLKEIIGSSAELKGRKSQILDLIIVAGGQCLFDNEHHNQSLSSKSVEYFIIDQAAGKMWPPKNPTKDDPKFTPMESLQQSRVGCSGLACGGMLYVSGGYHQKKGTGYPYCNDAARPSRCHWQGGQHGVPGHPQWACDTAFVEPEQGACNMVLLDTVEKYDFGTKKWTYTDPLSKPIAYHNMFSHDGFQYLVCGCTRLKYIRDVADQQKYSFQCVGSNNNIEVTSLYERQWWSGGIPSSPHNYPARLGNNGVFQYSCNSSLNNKYDMNLVAISGPNTKNSGIYISENGGFTWKLVDCWDIMKKCVINKNKSDCGIIPFANNTGNIIIEDIFPRGLWTSVNAWEEVEESDINLIITNQKASGKQPFVEETKTIFSNIWKRGPDWKKVTPETQKSFNFISSTCSTNGQFHVVISQGSPTNNTDGAIAFSMNHGTDFRIISESYDFTTQMQHLLHDLPAADANMNDIAWNDCAISGASAAKATPKIIVVSNNWIDNIGIYVASDGTKWKCIKSDTMKNFNFCAISGDGETVFFTTSASVSIPGEITEILPSQIYKIPWSAIYGSSQSAREDQTELISPNLDDVIFTNYNKIITNYNGSLIAVLCETFQGIKHSLLVYDMRDINPVWENVIESRNKEVFVDIDMSKDGRNMVIVGQIGKEKLGTILVSVNYGKTWEYQRHQSLFAGRQPRWSKIIIVKQNDDQLPPPSSPPIPACSPQSTPKNPPKIYWTIPQDNSTCILNKNLTVDKCNWDKCAVNKGGDISDSSPYIYSSKFSIDRETNILKIGNYAPPALCPCTAPPPPPPPGTQGTPLIKLYSRNEGQWVDIPDLPFDKNSTQYLTSCALIRGDDAVSSFVIVGIGCWLGTLQPASGARRFPIICYRHGDTLFQDGIKWQTIFKEPNKDSLYPNWGSTATLNNTNVGENHPYHQMTTFNGFGEYCPMMNFQNIMPIDCAISQPDTDSTSSPPQTIFVISRILEEEDIIDASTGYCSCILSDDSTSTADVAPLGPLPPLCFPIQNILILKITISAKFDFKNVETMDLNSRKWMTNVISTPPPVGNSPSSNCYVPFNTGRLESYAPRFSSCVMSKDNKIMIAVSEEKMILPDFSSEKSWWERTPYDSRQGGYIWISLDNGANWGKRYIPRASSLTKRARVDERAGNLENSNTIFCNKDWISRVSQSGYFGGELSSNLIWEDMAASQQDILGTSGYSQALKKWLVDREEDEYWIPATLGLAFFGTFFGEPAGISRSNKLWAAGKQRNCRKKVYEKRAREPSSSDNNTNFYPSRESDRWPQSDNANFFEIMQKKVIEKSESYISSLIEIIFPGDAAAFLGETKSLFSKNPETSQFRLDMFEAITKYITMAGAASAAGIGSAATAAATIAIMAKMFWWPRENDYGENVFSQEAPWGDGRLAAKTVNNDAAGGDRQVLNPNTIATPECANIRYNLTMPGPYSSTLWPSPDLVQAIPSAGTLAVAVSGENANCDDPKVLDMFWKATGAERGFNPCNYWQDGAVGWGSAGEDRHLDFETYYSCNSPSTPCTEQKVPYHPWKNWCYTEVDIEVDTEDKKQKIINTIGYVIPCAPSSSAHPSSSSFTVIAQFGQPNRDAVGVSDYGGVKVSGAHLPQNVIAAATAGMSNGLVENRGIANSSISDIPFFGDNLNIVQLKNHIRKQGKSAFYGRSPSGTLETRLNIRVRSEGEEGV